MKTWKDWYMLIPFCLGAILLIFGGWLIETPLLDSVPEEVFNRWYKVGILSIVAGGACLAAFLILWALIWKKK